MNEHNTKVTPAILRRVEGETDRSRPSRPVTPQNATGREIPAAAGRPALSSLTTAALVGLGLAAVEAARIALVHGALVAFFGDAAGTLPFAAVLTLGLAALDAGLLLRMFHFETAGDNGSMATWAAVGAWLIVTTANSVLAMYALAAAMPAGHELASVAPASVAIVLLLLRLLLVGALAWDAKHVLGR